MFSSAQVQLITGLPYHELDRVVRSGVVVPGISAGIGRGSVRLYDVADVLALHVVRELREAGASMATVRVAALFFRKPKRLPRLATLASLILATDGEEVLLLAEDALHRIRRLKTSPVHLVPMQGAVRALNAALSASSVVA